jgi:hypothetical protein
VYLDTRRGQSCFRSTVSIDVKTAYDSFTDSQPDLALTIHGAGSQKKRSTPSVAGECSHTDRAVRGPTLANKHGTNTTAYTRTSSATSWC